MPRLRHPIYEISEIQSCSFQGPRLKQTSALIGTPQEQKEPKQEKNRVGLKEFF